MLRFKDYKLSLFFVFFVLALRTKKIYCHFQKRNAFLQKKKYNMKREFFSTRFAFTALFALMLFGISASLSAETTRTAGTEDEWVLYLEDDGIQIYKKSSVVCSDDELSSDRELTLFRFVNTTDTNLQVKWKADYFSGASCVNCASDSDEYVFTLSVLAGEAIEGDCSSFRDRKLAVVMRYIGVDMSALTNVELSSVEVSPL